MKTLIMAAALAVAGLGARAGSLLDVPENALVVASGSVGVAPTQTTAYGLTVSNVFFGGVNHIHVSNGAYQLTFNCNLENPIVEVYKYSFGNDRDRQLIVAISTKQLGFYTSYIFVYNALSDGTYGMVLNKESHGKRGWVNGNRVMVPGGGLYAAHVYDYEAGGFVQERG